MLNALFRRWLARDLAVLELLHTALCSRCAHLAGAHLEVTGCRVVLEPATQDRSAVLCPCRVR